MGKRIRIKVGDVVAEAELFENDAPKTVASLWEKLPITDRTINARWSGDAWRTEGNHELLSRDAEVENKAGRLAAGDIIYYPGYKSGLLKIAMAYGPARWLGVYGEQVMDVSSIGKIDTNLDGFVDLCQRIIFDGPLTVEISRIE
jgi:hypothetical protein